MYFQYFSYEIFISLRVYVQFDNSFISLNISILICSLIYIVPRLYNLLRDWCYLTFACAQFGAIINNTVINMYIEKQCDKKEEHGLLEWERPWFKSLLHHLTTVQLEANTLSSLRRSFFICKVVVIIRTSRCVMKVNTKNLL